MAPPRRLFKHCLIEEIALNRSDWRDRIHVVDPFSCGKGYDDDDEYMFYSLRVAYCFSLWHMFIVFISPFIQVQFSKGRPPTSLSEIRGYRL